APLLGPLSGLGLLALLVAPFGQLIVTRVPELTLKLIIGTLIVLFGLRWLHKAVLRSAGEIAMHDENRASAQSVESLRADHEKTDWIAFTLALKAVFLEGREVVFIVSAVGGTRGVSWRAAASEVIGLFVGAWVQSGVSVAILAAAWLALPRLHVEGVAYVLAVALAVQLILATAAEARRKKA